MKSLMHGGTKTPCVYLSLKGKRSLRFSTPLSQDAAEKGRYESQIKPFVLLRECSELGFWIQQERLLGLIMFPWLSCWLRNGLNTGRTVRCESQLYQVSSCWQLPWFFFQLQGIFFAPFASGGIEELRTAAWMRPSHGLLRFLLFRSRLRWMGWASTYSTSETDCGLGY